MSTREEIVCKSLKENVISMTKPSSGSSLCSLFDLSSAWLYSLPLLPVKSLETHDWVSHDLKEIDHSKRKVIIQQKSYHHVFLQWNAKASICKISMSNITLVSVRYGCILARLWFGHRHEAAGRVLWVITACRYTAISHRYKHDIVFIQQFK